MSNRPFIASPEFMLGVFVTFVCLALVVGFASWGVS